MREHLIKLDTEFAFQTSVRFELLSVDHVSYSKLGASDVEGRLHRAIARGEGVIVVTGRMGSGKSSLIAAVTSRLHEGFVPLRVTVVGVDAGDPPAFARHVIQVVAELPETELTRHEREVVERAAATERVARRGHEVRAGVELAGGVVLPGRAVADLKLTAGEELTLAVDASRALDGLQRVCDVFWNVRRCPVLILDDTDHWAATPLAADAFFETTVRALGQLDAVVLVAAQAPYVQLPGYQRTRQTFTAEIELPSLPSPREALSRLLARRIEDRGVDAEVAELFAADALDLVAVSYTESVVEGRAGDLRRTLAVVRTALELAVDDASAERIRAGHVQEAMAKNPVPPESALGAL